MAKLASRSSRKQKKEKKKKINKIVGRGTLGLVIAVFIFWVVLQVSNFYALRAIKTVNAQMGDLIISTEANGIFMLQEELISAPRTGIMEPLSEEGERVSKGAVVARIMPLEGPEGGGISENIISPSTGLVWYHLDGWEGVYDQDTWNNSDLYTVFDNLNKNNKGASGIQTNEVNQGEPICKVVDNLIWPQLIIQFDLPGSLSLKEGELLRFDWKDGGSGQGRVKSLLKRKGKEYALIKLEEMRPFACARFSNLNVSCKKGEGIIIPRTALIKRDKDDGVYIMSVLGPEFKEVDIITSVNSEAAIQGISPGEEVVINPGVVKLIKKDIL